MNRFSASSCVLLTSRDSFEGRRWWEMLMSFALRSLKILTLLSPVAGSDDIEPSVLRGKRLGRSFAGSSVSFGVSPSGGKQAADVSDLGWDIQSSESESSHA
jgi:hypothetical protein